MPIQPQPEPHPDRVGVAAEAFVAWCLRCPHRLALALVMASVVLGAGGLRLSVESSFKSFLSDDHPFLKTTNEVVGTFGTHLPLLVALDAGRPVGEAELRAVTPFFESLASLPHIDRVAHPGNTSVLRGTGEGLEIVPMLEAAGSKSTTYPLVGKHGRSLAASAYLAYREGRDDKDAVEAMEALWDKLDAGEAPAGFEVHVTGFVAVYAEIARRIRSDLGVFLLISALAMALFLFWTYRKPTGVVAPLGVVLLTLVWTLGILGWSGNHLSISMTLLPPLVVVMGVADSLHYLNHVAFARAADPDGAPRDWVVRAAGHVGLPCLLTTLTTMVGFFSLGTSEIRPIRIFGVMAGCAIAIAMLLTFTALPLLLMRFPPAPADPTRRRWDPIAPFLQLTRRSLHHPRALVAAWLALCTVAAVLVTRVEVETGFAELFPEGDPMQVDQRWTEERFWGADVLGIRWIAPEGTDLASPEAMEALLGFTAWLEGRPAVSTVLGLPTFLDDLRTALVAGDAGPPPAWSRPLVAQLTLLLEQADAEVIERFATGDRRQAVLIAQVDIVGARAMREIVEAVEARLVTHPVPGRIDMFGPVYMFQQLIFTVVDSLIRSFGLALVMVWLFVTVGLRSLKLGSLGMVPSLVPILVAGGVMGLLTISLNDTTVMVASIGIGIAVDDTIHLLVAWRRARAAGLGPDAAVQRAISVVGPALVATSLVLLAGFGTTVFSSFRPPRTFAGLSCVLVLVALAADLMLLTVLLGAGRGQPTSAASGSIRLSSAIWSKSRS